MRRVTICPPLDLGVRDANAIMCSIYTEDARDRKKCPKQLQTVRRRLLVSGNNFRKDSCRGKNKTILRWFPTVSIKMEKRQIPTSINTH